MSHGMRLGARALTLAFGVLLLGPWPVGGQGVRREAPAAKHIDEVTPSLFANVARGVSITYRVVLKSRRMFNVSSGDGLEITTQGNVTVGTPRQVDERTFEVDFSSNASGGIGTADIRINFTTPKGKLKFVQGGVSVGGNSLVSVGSTDNRILSRATVGTSPWGVDTGGAETVQAGRAFVANSGSGTVSVVQVGTDTVLQTVTVGAGPRHVAIAGPIGSQLAFVTNFFGDSVSVVDVEDFRLIDTIPVGDGPIGIGLVGVPGSEFAYVANFNADTVSVIDTRSNTVTATFAVGDGPTGIGVGGPVGGQTVVVTEQNQNTVALFLSTNNTLLRRLNVGSGPVYAAVGGALNQRVAVVNSGGTVTALDVAERRVLGTVRVGASPLGAVFVGPAAAPTVYVANSGDGTLSEVDYNALRVVDTVFIGGTPRGVTAIGAQGSERILATN